MSAAPTWPIFEGLTGQRQARHSRRDDRYGSLSRYVVCLLGEPIRRWRKCLVKDSKLKIGEIDMSQKHKEIIEKVNAAFAKGSTEGFLSFCAEDVEWTMVGDKTVKGKDAIRQWMASMGDMEPPKFTVDNVIAEVTSPPQTAT